MRCWSPGPGLSSLFLSLSSGLESLCPDLSLPAAFSLSVRMMISFVMYSSRRIRYFRDEDTSGMVKLSTITTMARVFSNMTTNSNLESVLR